MDIMTDNKKEKWKEKSHSAKIRLLVCNQSLQNPRPALGFMEKNPYHQYCIQMVFLSHFSPALEQRQPLLDEHAFCFSWIPPAHLFHSQPSAFRKLISISQRNAQVVIRVSFKKLNEKKYHQKKCRKQKALYCLVVSFQLDCSLMLTVNWKITAFLPAFRKSICVFLSPSPIQVNSLLGYFQTSE